jgi:F-type H+-transporting ATPase subunit delta
VVSKVLVSKISEPYAGALLELAKSKDSVDAIAEDVGDLLWVFAMDSTELKRFLVSPIISNESKKKLLLKVYGSKINKSTLDFLFVLIDKRRINFFEAIGEKYLELVLEFGGICVATVTTRLPLKWLQQKRVITKLTEFTGGKEIRLMEVTDHSILGGVIVQIGSQVIDISLKGQLRQISDSLQSPLVI